jgi:hypothetical protein
MQTSTLISHLAHEIHWPDHLRYNTFKAVLEDICPSFVNNGRIVD